MKTFRKILIDMVPVVLGVLIALLINGWKDRQDDKRFVDRVLDSIGREMASNKEEFNEVLALQYAFEDTLEAYLYDDSISLVEIANKANGLQLPTMKNVAWRSFLNTKLEIIDFEIISLMAEIEEEKQFLRIKSEKLLEFTYENAKSKDSEVKEIFLLHLYSIMDSEEGLLKHYETYLSKFDVP